MRNAITCLTIGMLCIATVSYAALPADTSEILNPTQKGGGTLSDSQTQSGDALREILGSSTEPQEKDKKKEKMVYSSPNLSEAQKIVELANKYKIKIYDTGLGYEGVARVAREALEEFLPYAPPSLQVINIYAGSGEGLAHCDGTINVGVVSHDEPSLYSHSIRSGSLPPVGVGDGPVEHTMATLFHEGGHEWSLGELGGGFPHRIFELYYNVEISGYAGSNLHEREAEFISLMFTRPDVMKAYCANYPSMKVAYDATKSFMESHGVKVPTERLMHPPNSPDWK